MSLKSGQLRLIASHRDVPPLLQGRIFLCDPDGSEPSGMVRGYLIFWSEKWPMTRWHHMFSETHLIELEPDEEARAHWFLTLDEDERPPRLVRAGRAMEKALHEMEFATSMLGGLPNGLNAWDLLHTHQLLDVLHTSHPEVKRPEMDARLMKLFPQAMHLCDHLTNRELEELYA